MFRSNDTTGYLLGMHTCIMMHERCIKKLIQFGRRLVLFPPSRTALTSKIDRRSIICTDWQIRWTINMRSNDMLAQAYSCQCDKSSLCSLPSLALYIYLYILPSALRPPSANLGIGSLSCDREAGEQPSLFSRVWTKLWQASIQAIVRVWSHKPLHNGWIRLVRLQLVWCQ